MATINNPVGWFELYVSDMNRAKIFYEKVFNRPLSDLPMPGADYSMCTFRWTRKQQAQPAPWYCTRQ